MSITHGIHLPHPAHLGEAPFRKRQIAALGAAALTVFGGVKVAECGVHELRPSSHHEFSAADLAGKPQDNVTVQGGVETTVLSVDPNLINDGQGLSDVENYVFAQGVETKNGQPVVLDGQTVNVPVIK